MASPQHYVDLQYRLEVPIASRRSAPVSAQPPRFILGLTTEPEIQVQSASSGTASEDEAKLLENQSQQTTHWMSADYETLVQIARALEEAMQTHSSTAYRRINRLVK
jgi:hypothetical protein